MSHPQTPRALSYADGRQTDGPHPRHVPRRPIGPCSLHGAWCHQAMRVDAPGLWTTTKAADWECWWCSFTAMSLSKAKLSPDRGPCMQGCG